MNTLITIATYKHGTLRAVPNAIMTMEEANARSDVRLYFRGNLVQVEWVH